MKNFALTNLLILSIVLFTNGACAQSNRITNKNYNVTAFSALVSNTVGNIEFTQSPNYSVSAEGDEEMVNNLIVNVKDNKLNVSMKKDLKRMFGNRQSGKLVIRISSPNLSLIESDGVGNLELKGRLDAPQFKIVSTGVGNINARDLASDNIDITSDGVGNIEMKGSATSVSVASKGVGNVKLENLKAARAKIESGGVGNVTCHATESVDINADGIGNVTYYGNPITKNIRKNGIGKVKSGNQ
ncbi:MAG TPA: DUF2807 domain-containing protein [Petrimonas sp.]|uniref:head GIN domain-containing protein n=1 Tax=Petrimonas sp. TaxID=2023866 RepID=UPI000965BF78|nr:MAG: hypothetical protein BGO33_14975 [Bacteroidia bacterium 43-41]HHV84785.1 DUF2807 domain-containing protein [Petrimonas sp.]